MPKVLIYTTKECGFCKATKKFFKENNIKYSEKDVGNDKAAAKEMVKKSGQMGVPVIDIDGKILVGFEKEKLKELLKIK